jgi:hypothetical protein
MHILSHRTPEIFHFTNGMDSSCLAQSNLIRHPPLFQCFVNLVSYDVILKKRHKPRSQCRGKATILAIIYAHNDSTISHYDEILNSIVAIEA